MELASLGNAHPRKKAKEQVMMIPKKLKPNDMIRIISPSCSLSIVSEDVRRTAEQRIGRMGFRVSYSEFAYEMDEFRSSSIESRVRDIHDAFLDKEVRGILTTLGGFNCNQILKYLNYALIKDNPKVICGFSDITALTNAIYARTGLVCYSGPHFSSFGMKKGFAYTETYFRKCVLENGPISIVPSARWSDDKWFADQENRRFTKNKGVVPISEGKAEGRIIGGNLCTLNLPQGTDFMPSLKDAILFLEDDALLGGLSLTEFDRNLQSLVHLPGFVGVRGIVIGRFQRDSKMSIDSIRKMVRSKTELRSIPILCNVDFGHTTPMVTFPIGGKASIEAHANVGNVVITVH